MLFSLVFMPVTWALLCGEHQEPEVAGCPIFCISEFRLRSDKYFPIHVNMIGFDHAFTTYTSGFRCQDGSCYYGSTFRCFDDVIAAWDSNPGDSFPGASGHGSEHVNVSACQKDQAYGNLMDTLFVNVTEPAFCKEDPRPAEIPCPTLAIKKQMYDLETIFPLRFSSDYTLNAVLDPHGWHGPLYRCFDEIAAEYEALPANHSFFDKSFWNHCTKGTMASNISQLIHEAITAGISEHPICNTTTLAERPQAECPPVNVTYGADGTIQLHFRWTDDFDRMMEYEDYCSFNRTWLTRKLHEHNGGYYFDELYEHCTTSETYAHVHTAATNHFMHSNHSYQCEYEDYDNDYDNDFDFGFYSCIMDAGLERLWTEECFFGNSSNYTGYCECKVQSYAARLQVVYEFCGEYTGADQLAYGWLRELTEALDCSGVQAAFNEAERTGLASTRATSRACFRNLVESLERPGCINNTGIWGCDDCIVPYYVAFALDVTETCGYNLTDDGHILRNLDSMNCSTAAIVEAEKQGMIAWKNKNNNNTTSGSGSGDNSNDNDNDNDNNNTSTTGDTDNSNDNTTSGSGDNSNDNDNNNTSTTVASTTTTESVDLSGGFSNSLSIATFFLVLNAC